MNTKISNKILVIIFGLIIAVALFITVCNAAGTDWGKNPASNFYVGNVNVGDTVTLDRDWAANHLDFFCVCLNQSFGNEKPYKCISKINIVGNKATDQNAKSVDSIYNGIIAYDLSVSNGKPGIVDLQNPAQAQIFNDMAKWIGQVGFQFSGLYNGFATNGNLVDNYNQQINTDAEAYANSLSKPSLTNKTQKENIKTTAYEKDQKTYLKIGPFNYEFRDKLESITLLGKDGNGILTPSAYGVYNGTDFKEVSLEKIKSGEQFYVIIPANSGIAIIDTIVVKETHRVKSATIAFWESQQTSQSTVQSQNLIQFSASERQEEAEDEWDDVNIPLLINISGFVWEDLLGGKDNTYAANGEDIYTEGDSLLEGITVRVLDKDGNIAKNNDGKECIATTDAKGEYRFENLLIGELENYNVVFEYNGFTYTSVKALVGDDNKVNSKASEVVEQRKSLNSAYTTITKDDTKDRSTGYSKNANSEVTGTLTYKNDTEKYESTFESTTYDNKTYSGTNLTGDTKTISFNLNEQEYTTNDDGSMEIKYINFGVLKREQPNISIANDLSKVQVQVNGYGTTYTSDSSGNEYGAWTEEKRTNMQVKFGTEYGPYYREIYPSDIQFSSELSEQEDAKKLKVYAIYKVTITNNSNSLTMAVPEIVNYYDSNFTIVEDGTDFPDGVKLNGVKAISVNDSTCEAEVNYTTTEGTPYKTGRITIADAPKIEAGKSLVLEITYQVSDETVLSLLNGDKTLNNVAEISAYSTYYSSDIEGCSTGDIYAGIDKNSAPENATPGEIETYEDDTDAAPAFKLTAKGVRQLAGTVFEDNTGDDGILTGEARLGNGIFDDRERTVRGVKVELLNAETGQKATYYPYEVDENGQPTTSSIDGLSEASITENDGNFIFKGIIPDKYLFKYTYENGITKIFNANGEDIDITVQNYKSTVITSNTIKDAFENGENLTWYKEKEDRYSKARDDLNARADIDNELKLKEGTTTLTKTLLFAETPTFDIPLEYESIFTDAENTNQFIHKIANMDFGIAERPKQSVDLDKEVSNIKVTLPNGQILIDGDPRKETLNYLTIIKDANGKIDEIYITIDTELLQGSHIEIKYDFILENNSELDYIDKTTKNISKSYYYYGDTDSNSEVVKLTSASLIDYVDSEMVLKEGEEATWKVVDDLVANGLNWGISDLEKEKLLKNFSTVVIAEPISEENAIEPGDIKITTISVEKLLGNADELVFTNNGEVVKITKTGGRDLVQKMANYGTVLAENPDTLPGEIDEAKAGAVTVIPPTGFTNNTIIYAIIATISLAVLGAGIYGTKRFLKK